MAAKKKKEQQGPEPGQQRPSEHLHGATSHPLPTALYLDTPPGMAKMSQVLGNFVEPYLKQADSGEEIQTLFLLAMAAWNAALLPQPQRRTMLDNTVAGVLDQFPNQKEAEVRGLLDQMVARKLARFGANKRFILELDVTSGEGELHINVVATP